MKKILLFALLLVTLCSLVLHAETVLVSGDRYALDKVDWNGTTYQKNGMTKVGAYIRTGSVAYDYETLCDFSLDAVDGDVLNAVLKVKLAGGECGIDDVISLFEQNKRDFDRDTVCYNSFDYTQWTHELASIAANQSLYGWVEFQSSALTAVVQGWIDQPSTNNGLLLTANLYHFDYSINIEDVVLELEVSPKKHLIEEIEQYYRNEAWDDITKYTYDYTVQAGNEVTDRNWYNYENNAWVYRDTVKFKETDSSNRTVYEYIAPTKYTYTFDADGSLAEKIVDTRIHPKHMWYYYRYVYTYNTDGSIMEEKKYSRYDETYEWNYLGSYLYTYDTAGRVIEKTGLGDTLIYSYSANTAECVINGTKKTVSTFDNNGNLIVLETSYFSNNAWSPSEKELWNYDEKGLLIEYISQMYYTGTGWVNDQKESSVYNESGKLIVFDTYYWNSVQNIWEARNETRYTYNEEGYMTEKSLLMNDNGTFIYSSRVLYAYEN